MVSSQGEMNYQRIATAIDYLHTHFKEQPSLEKLAELVHLSPFHFQRMFTDWAGTSPKKFLQYISVNYAKKLLKEHPLSIADAAIETGLSGTSRLHELFVNIEHITPAEYKEGGKNLQVQYSFAEGCFGRMLVASTPKGICFLSFVDDDSQALTQLFHQFPQANLVSSLNEYQQTAINIFQQPTLPLPKLKLHLKGTPFQLKVWEALLTIEKGKLTTYGEIAHHINQPKASRAVGSAIGSNPVAYLIPCHRVIQATGLIGGYMWGSTRKTAIIGWEAAQTNSHC